jgi:hypothetical protein
MESKTGAAHWQAPAFDLDYYQFLRKTTALRHVDTLHLRWVQV